MAQSSNQESFLNLPPLPSISIRYRVEKTVVIIVYLVACVSSIWYMMDQKRPKSVVGVFEITTDYDEYKDTTTINIINHSNKVRNNLEVVVDDIYIVNLEEFDSHSHKNLRMDRFTHKYHVPHIWLQEPGWQALAQPLQKSNAPKSHQPQKISIFCDKEIYTMNLEEEIP